MTIGPRILAMRGDFLKESRVREAALASQSDFLEPKRLAYHSRGGRRSISILEVLRFGPRFRSGNRGRTITHRRPGEYVLMIILIVIMTIGEQRHCQFEGFDLRLQLPKLFPLAMQPSV